VLVAAVYVGAVAVAGTLPYIVQNLVRNPTSDIYSLHGGIPKGLIAKLNLGQLCLLQARLFALSILLFAAFALARAF
jgi:hypothetical protein